MQINKIHLDYKTLIWRHFIQISLKKVIKKNKISHKNSLIYYEKDKNI